MRAQECVLPPSPSVPRLPPRHSLTLMASPLPHLSYAAKKVSSSLSTSELKASACTAFLYAVSTSAGSCAGAITAVVTYLPAQHCVTFPGDRRAPVVPNTSTCSCVWKTAVSGRGAGGRRGHKQASPYFYLSFFSRRQSV